MRVVSNLLKPLAMIYKLITGIRNRAFDKGILKSYESSVPCIAVGNLSMGGTGKTPMIEYLIRQFPEHNLGVVSRGYGRKSKGLLKVRPEGKAEDFGDECLQIAQKFPVQVWVSEKRELGVKAAEAASCDLILLDDAFQHRYVKAQIYILLSTWQRPYFRDYVLPAGQLRESRKGASRANHIIFTKCPQKIGVKEKAFYQQSSKRYSPAPAAFAHYRYREALDQFGKLLPSDSKLGLITGIAKVQALEEYLREKYQLEESWKYRDHYRFKDSDLVTHLRQAKERGLQLICTEKDRVKLWPILERLSPDTPLYTIQVEHHIAEEESARILADIRALIP